MTPYNFILRFGIAISALIVFFALHFALQQKQLYDLTLGRYTGQYELKSEGPLKINKPYDEITNDKLVRWDAVHYKFIKENMYDQAKAGGDYIFAFFPLFPLIWKLSMLNPTGIILLNYIFFAIALIIISSLFSAGSLQQKLKVFIFCLTLPTTVIFIIPYTEATFMLCFAAGVWGIFKKKYWIYFIAMILFATSRPAIVVIGLAMLCTEIFLFIQHKNIFFFIKEFTIKIIPLVLGTLIVSFVQYLYDGSSWVKFIDAQKNWNHHLQVPHNLVDWSHEGFGLNMATLFLFIPASAIYLFLSLITNVKIEKPEAAIFLKGTDDSEIKNYLFILSLFYVIGSFSFILLYQGGSFNGLFRYVVCTPFFYIAILHLTNNLISVEFEKRILYFGFALFSSLFVMTLANYSTYWNFDDLGYILLISSLAYLLFNQYVPKSLNAGTFFLLLFLNILWNTYMFNCYITSGWLFT